MAMPRKGSRLITVDTVTYRWLVRRRPTLSQACGWRPLTFAVEADDLPGAPFKGADYLDPAGSGSRGVPSINPSIRCNPESPASAR